MIIYQVQHLIPNTLYKKGTSRKTQKFATKLAWCLPVPSIVHFSGGIGKNLVPEKKSRNRYRKENGTGKNSQNLYRKNLVPEKNIGIV